MFLKERLVDLSARGGISRWEQEVFAFLTVIGTGARGWTLVEES